MKEKILKIILVLSISLFNGGKMFAQFSTAGCVDAGFGIDAGLYSGAIEFGSGTPAIGSNDWFQGVTGTGVIDETNPSAVQTLLQGGGNPTYVRRIKVPTASVYAGKLWGDGLFARDEFGGSCCIDNTSYINASKNGEDPAIWATGPHSVLGKNDLIDIGGFMLHDGPTNDDPLWFYGIINRAEPGGDAYMDFELYVEPVTYSNSNGFSSGGPDLGHTAFTFDNSGNIINIGDAIFNYSMINGGTSPNLEIRIWVSYADWLANKHPANFTYGGLFDGASQNAAYGYANIVNPAASSCGFVNGVSQHPAAPPWGTLNTKYNTWGTSYMDWSFSELAVNMSELGIASGQNTDTCSLRWRTFIVKTRASASFTAQLKDFGGPFPWGRPGHTITSSSAYLNCQTPVITLTANPYRTDANYHWTTSNGHIISNPDSSWINVDSVGTYTVNSTYNSNGCPMATTTYTVTYDPSKPFLTTPTATATTSCNGSNGTVTLSYGGGTPPVTFLWSNGATTQNISGLAPGSYYVTVTDALGCTKSSAPVTVLAPTPTNLGQTIVNASCNGSSNGSITLSVTGKSPFTFLWSNGKTTQNLINLAAGTYAVTVTNGDGCTTTSSYIITQPTIVSGTITATNETNAALNNGTASVTASGGTPVYTYLWSTSATTQSVTGLSRGVYTVTITDSNNCTATATTNIWEPEICNDGIDNDGNGLTDCDDPACIPPSPGSITPGNSNPCVGTTVT